MVVCEGVCEISKVCVRLVKSVIKHQVSSVKCGEISKSYCSVSSYCSVNTWVSRELVCILQKQSVLE